MVTKNPPMEGRYTVVSFKRKVGFTVLYNTKVTSWHFVFLRKNWSGPASEKTPFWNTKNAPEANPEAPHVPRKKTSYFPLYWVVDRDPYNGLL